MTILTKEQESLLPCPFCGSQGELSYFNNGLVGESWAFVECSQCGARSAMSDDIGDTTVAVAAWNTRTESQRELLEVLERVERIHGLEMDIDTHRDVLEAFTKYRSVSSRGTGNG